MTREYTNYYGKYKTSVYSSVEPAGITRGEIFVGCRFEKTLLDNNGLHPKLLMYKIGEIAPEYAGVTILKLRNYSDAASIGAVAEVNMILQPADPATLDPTYGKAYKTYVAYSTEMTITDVGDILIAHEFKLGPNAILYKVQPGTVVQRRSRKTVSRVA